MSADILVNVSAEVIASIKGTNIYSTYVNGSIVIER